MYDFVEGFYGLLCFSDMVFHGFPWEFHGFSKDFCSLLRFRLGVFNDVLMVGQIWSNGFLGFLGRLYRFLSSVDVL